MLTETKRLFLEREKRRREKASLPLLDFIPRVSPDLSRPVHLAPFVDLFERVAGGEEVRAVVSTPPQHGKSVSSFHALAWLLSRNPKLRCAYGTYGADFARDQARKAHLVARRAGVPLSRVTSDRWETRQGGGVVWTGVGGPLTGHPVDGLLLLDDLVKNRADAESGTIRDRIMDWLSSVAFTRLHPGASVVFIATRWHPDDPHGRLIERGWEYVELPAVGDDDAWLDPLWPEFRPVEWLQRVRGEVGEYDWSALFMCRPRPRGTAVFPLLSTFEDLPVGAYSEARGFDGAYTERTSADFSVLLEGRRYPGSPTVFVTNMLRAQTTARRFLAMMKARNVKGFSWFRSGTEKGLEELLLSEGFRVDAQVASRDKFVRAQPAGVLSERGHIAVPHPSSVFYGPWVEEFRREVLQFTGLGDKRDDIVDALASLVFALGVGRGGEFRVRTLA